MYLFINILFCPLSFIFLFCQKNTNWILDETTQDFFFLNFYLLFFLLLFFTYLNNVQYNEINQFYVWSV